MRTLLLVFLAACGGSSATPASPGGDSLALPGECVDPAADAATRLAGVSPSGDPPAESSSLDLDGDGTNDKVFTAGAAYTEAGAVYIMRGDCGHFVGDVGGEPAVGSDRTHGLFDVKVDEVSSCEGARCGCEPGTQWFRFDGTEYVLDEAASTQSSENDCPEDA